jgi:hypothetical protein
VKGGDGYAQLSESAFLNDFAQDVAPARARALYAVQGRISDELITGRTTQAAWRDKPTFYAVSKNDRTINPDLERFMATGWAPRQLNSMPATCRSCRNPVRLPI